jgi:hypothetical protein
MEMPEIHIEPFRREMIAEASNVLARAFVTTQPGVKLLARFCGADPDGQSAVVLGQTVRDGWCYRSHGHFILIV